jgi:colanic acid/amylovoran biosynthesis glycosyltransferase
MSAPALASSTQTAIGESSPPPPPLRIAYLTTEYPKVSHTFIRREIRALEARGHRVLRLAIRSGGPTLADAADREEAARTIACLELPKARFLAAFAAMTLTRPWSCLSALGMTWRMSRASDRGRLRHLAYLAEAAVLLRICEAQGIHHVHVHFGTNAAAVARLMRRLSRGRLTYSMTVHGPDEFDAPRGFALREKVADAEFVVAISDYCAAQIRRWSDPDHWRRIHVVRCTVGPEFFDHAAPVPSSSRTLLSIGRLSAQKGQLLLIEAMARLRDDGLDARLVLAGDGEMRGVIERAVADHGLVDRVLITGWVDEARVRRLLREARALVQPSFAEGLPVVMLEAMAMQRPVVATHIAGVPELVRPGENGWLVPAGNVGELMAAMRSALLDPAERLSRMGQRGAQRVRERHSTGTETLKLEALLHGATAAGHARDR